MYGEKDGFDENKISDAVKEHILAAEYGWTIEYIRQLRYQDFLKHFYICLMKIRLDVSLRYAAISARGLF